MNKPDRETRRYNIVEHVEATSTLWIKWESNTCPKCRILHRTAIRITGPGGVVLELENPNEIEQQRAEKTFEKLAAPIRDMIRAVSEAKGQMRHRSEECYGCPECDREPCSRGSTFEHPYPSSSSASHLTSRKVQ